MDQSDNQPDGLSRRDVLKCAAAAGLAMSAGATCARAAMAGDNPIVQENAKPGTRDWMLSKTSVGTGKDWYRSRAIEGYCSEMSVRAGDTLKVMVSANPVSEFDLEIFRTGYYGGTGARSMKKFTNLQGKTQPDAEIGENRLRECKWEPSVEFEIPGSPERTRN